MTWRVPPYDVAVAEIEAHVRATYQVHGIVIAGSIVRGEPGPTSDFDVFIVHREPWRLRDQRWFNGVPTELFVNPPERIRGYFKSEHGEGRPSTAHMFTTGELLAGADDVATELVPAPADAPRTGGDRDDPAQRRHEPDGADNAEPSDTADGPVTIEGPIRDALAGALERRLAELLAPA